MTLAENIAMGSAPVGKPFAPGTLGWTAADLADAAIEASWEAGAYEIVEGVLTIMPAAYFEGGETLANLIHAIKKHQEASGVAGRFSVEVDLVLAANRVARADGVFLTPADVQRQRAAVRREGGRDARRARMLVAPTLVIEVVSPGHEAHDQATKRRWYAEAGVPHYWILDCFRHTMACLALQGDRYVTEAAASGNATLMPSLFPGLSLNLANVWPAPDAADGEEGIPQ